MYHSNPEFKEKKLGEKEGTPSNFPQKTGRVCNFVFIVEALGK